MTDVSQFNAQKPFSFVSEEVPRPASKNVYLSDNLKPYSRINHSASGVWVAFFLFLLGAAISPFDILMGALIGVPALMYLMFSANMLNEDKH